MRIEVSGPEDEPAVLDLSGLSQRQLCRLARWMRDEDIKAVN